MFARKLIDTEVAEWQFDGFALLIDSFETSAGLVGRRLMTPTSDAFPELEEEFPTQAERIFHQVKFQLGLNDRDIFELEGRESRPDSSLGGLAMVETKGNLASGTYQFIPKPRGQRKARSRHIIRYDMGMENQPECLVATFAHELSHALHHRAKETLDVEPELYELFTDLTAIFLGYGIFLANTRFEFSQFTNSDTQGWQAQGSGYLPEADIVFATALFMRIKDLPMDTALPYLKPRLRKMLKKAWRQLDKHWDEVEALRARNPVT